MNNQETQGTTNDVDPASVDRVVLPRWVYGDEAIAFPAGCVVVCRKITNGIDWLGYEVITSWEPDHYCRGMIRNRGVLYGDGVQYCRIA
jgi:hypothetical protein